MRDGSRKGNGRDDMGGFTFAGIDDGPIAFTSVNVGQRNLILEAMVSARVKWVVRASDCPDCMYAHVTRASVLHSLREARKTVEREPTFFLNSPIRWSHSASSREAFFGVVDALLAEMLLVTAPTVVILDDFTYCEHPRMGKKKRRGRGV